MGFPDRIIRTLDLPHPIEAVWAALTTAEGLSGWFSDASLELRPGGAGQLRWPDGFTDQLHVERVEAPSVFGFTWTIHGLPADDPRRTYVEFTLEPTPEGTRLTLVESGFAQLGDGEYQTALDGHEEGWGRELGELETYLSAV